MTFNPTPVKPENITPKTLEKKKPLGVLPIDAHRESIVEQIGSNQSVIIVGETGSGKTTRTPVYLLEEFPNKKIAVTSPRVLPARSVSKYVANQKGQSVGEEVGLITRDKREISEKTRVTFMTDGILLNMLRKDPMLLELDIVMVDEAHERSLNIDLSLGLLKQAQKLRAEKGGSELKIIVTSATIEEQKFADYFDKSPVNKVPGRLYPVDLEYIKMDEDADYTEEAGILANKIINSGEDGDVLIFMPGEEEINRTIEAINKLVNKDEVDVLPLFGSMNPQDQDKIFSRNGKRKIIVSTNIAETSVTIDGVKHVIDSGYAKQREYNPVTGIDAMSLVEVSKANLNQRMGRAGRTAPGKCYRLMSQNNFESREDFQKPEIQRFDLGEVVLKMKDMGIKDVEGFDFIDSPSRERIHDAIEGLKKLGALNENGDITEIGQEMARLQLRPDLSRMLIEAKHFGCLNQMVDICAMMSAPKQIFIRPRKTDNSNEIMENNRKLVSQNTLKIADSDVLTFLNVWNKWEEARYAKSFAFDHLLNTKALNDVGLIRAQLLRALGEDNINVNNGNDLDKMNITKCLLAGIPDAIFYSTDNGYNYNPVVSDPHLVNVQVFPGSSVFKRGGSLILAMNINKSEKIVKNKYGGPDIKKSTLYARTCHKLTLDELKTALPDSVKEEISGSPFRGYSGTFQAYNILINGKFILQESRKVEDIAVVSDVPKILSSGVSRSNQQAIDEFSSLCIRSGGKFKKPDYDYLDNFYASVISENNIKTREDLENNKDKFAIKLSDFISDEEIEEIERDSPKEITIGSRAYKVNYSQIYSGASTSAYVELSSEDDVNNVLNFPFPSFKNVREFVYRHGYTTFYSERELREYRDRNFLGRSTVYSSQESVPEGNTSLGSILSNLLKGKEAEPSEPVKVVNITEQQPKPEKKIQEKEEMTTERRKEFVATFEEMKEIISNIKIAVNELPAGPNQKLKKETYLHKIKELNSQCNAFIKNLDGDIKLEVVSVNGSVLSVKNSIKTLLNQISQNSKTVNNFFEYFDSNKEKLIESAKRNEVELDDSLAEKVSKKVFDLTLKEGRRISDKEADEILIELV